MNLTAFNGKYSIAVSIDGPRLKRLSMALGPAGRPGGAATRRVVLRHGMIAQDSYLTTQHDSGFVLAAAMVAAARAAPKSDV